MIVTEYCVNDVREWFRELKSRHEYVIDKSGCKMIEVIGATFIADEPAIFGTVNEDYVKREIDWYKSMSLNVNDIPGGTPTAWKACADKDGLINSNYGFLVWNSENHDQYKNVLSELKKNPESRRANMIYTRPSMWKDYNHNGRSDFICTDTVQYFIRDNQLISLVKMRSNDLVWGYKNDRYWQAYVQEQLAKDLGIEVGSLVWHVGSLHVYERHFHLINE